ncbi:polysaccharide biosynthesis protein [Lysobacter tyrosinilyticus]
MNVLGYGYAQLVTLAVQLLLVPFFLKYWGAARYADWLVLTGLPTMLTLLDLGVAQSLASRATMEASAGRWTEARASLHTANAFTLVLSLLILVLAVTVGQWVDWSGLLKLETLQGHDSRVIMFAMAAYLCVGLMGGPLDACLRTIDRAAISAFLLANRRLLDVVVSIGVLLGGGGAVELAVTLLVGQVLALIVLQGLAIRWSPAGTFGLTHASWRIFRETLKPGLAYMGFPVAQIVTLQGGLQVLNLVAPPSVIVAFTMARTLMRLIMQAGVVANNALKPEISRLAGQGRLVVARRFSRTAGILIFVLCCLAYVGLVTTGPLIVHWWGHGKVQVNHMDLALIGAHALANVAWFVPAATLVATNRHVSVAVAYGISSCAGLLVWYVLKWSLSPVIGASLVLLVPEVCAAVCFWVVHSRNVASSPSLKESEGIGG